MVDLLLIFFRGRVVTLKSEFTKNGFGQRCLQMFKSVKNERDNDRVLICTSDLFLFFSFVNM